MPKKFSKNIKTVLDVLKDEVRGDVASALRKITDDYSMTWVYKGKTRLFPHTGKSIKKELKRTYPIKGREYDLRNVAEGKDLVMLELIESYPDPKTKKTYRTPLVLVLEMQNGKIKTGRHYCDPKISFMHLSKNQIEAAFRGKRRPKLVIKG